MRKAEIIELARKYKSPLERVQRIFLEEPPFFLDNKRDTEFEIKNEVSSKFFVPIRSVVFCGSAHLGFSPYKDKDFIPGESDLDLAIISPEAFQRAWMTLNECTRAFNDLSPFSIFREPEKTAELAREMISKRGVIHLSKMPRCKDFDEQKTFLDSLSKNYKKMFSQIHVSFYLNEYAFCWKQHSALQEIMSL